jgi:hypothetical protein
MAANQLTGAEPERLLFTTRNGAPVDYSHWRTRVWLPAVAKAGVPQATLAIYAQVVPEADRAAAKALGRTFFKRSRTRD